MSLISSVPRIFKTVNALIWRCALILLMLFQSFQVMAQDATATDEPALPLNPVHVRVYETTTAAYPEIKVYFSVLNRQNGRVLPITRENVQAFLGPSPDALTPIAVESVQSQPNTARKLNLVLCFDLTASNSDDFLQRQKNTAFELIDALDVNDAVAIVAQSDRGAEVRFALRADHGGARNAIDDLSIVEGSGNAFLDGVNAAVAVIGGVSETQSRNAVVIMTDVVEPQGSTSAAQTIELANQLNTPLYMIGYNDAAPQVLDEFSNATNGFTYLQRGSDKTFDRLTRDITDFLNQEYVATLRASLPTQETPYHLRLMVDVGGDTFSVEVPEVIGTARPLTVTFPLIEDGQTFSDEIHFEPQIVYADGSPVQNVQAVYTLQRSPATRSPAPLTTGDTQNPDFNWDLTAKPGGEYEVKLTVEDKYGNQGEQSVIFNVASPLKVDFVDPTDTSHPITSATYFSQSDNHLVMRVQGSYGVSGLTLRLDNQVLGTPVLVEHVSTMRDNHPFTLYDFRLDTTSLAPGHHMLMIEAVDNRGNVATQTLEVDISLTPEDPINLVIFVVVIVILVMFLVSLTLVRRATQRPSVTRPPSLVSAPPVMSPPTAARPRASLTVMANGLPGRREYALMERNYIVGRGDNVDIQVLGLNASRTHAELRWDGMAFMWIELTPEKRNPALINGVPVTQKQALQHGDHIQLGDTVFLFRLQ